MKVFVYYNLHKKVWSVKALEGENKGRVIRHENEVMLYHPVGKVSEAGRQRVLREKRKNVHAGIVGYLAVHDGILDTVRDEASVSPWYEQITYNPYKYTGFVYKSDETPFTGASLAVMKNKEVYVV